MSYYYKRYNYARIAVSIFSQNTPVKYLHTIPDLQPGEIFTYQKARTNSGKQTIAYTATILRNVFTYVKDLNIFNFSKQPVKFCLLSEQHSENLYEFIHSIIPCTHLFSAVVFCILLKSICLHWQKHSHRNCMTCPRGLVTNNRDTILSQS